MKNEVIDLANRQQVYLERLKAGFDKKWEPTQEELRQRMREVIGGLDAVNLQDLDRKALQKALIDLRKSHIQITQLAIEEFYEELPDLAAYASSLEVKSLSTLVARVRLLAPTARQAYNAALQRPVQATGELLENFVKDWSAKDAMRVSNVVQKGWAQGRSVSQMVSEVVGSKKANYADGILETSRRHASAVIHTSTQHTANAARMNVWERNSDIVQKYEWLSTLDRRTTTQCKSLDGEQFEFSKGPMPPLHINCRSTTIPVLEKEFDFLDKGATRASGGVNPGYVSDDLTYYDWLKTQPEKFQKVALGESRAKLFQEGGLTPERFAKLNIGRDFEPLTLEQMRKIEPDAFKKAGL